MVTTEPVPTGNTYDKYASTNPIEQRMMRGFFDALDHMLTGLTPATVVEVGAGEGRVTERLVERFPDATVIGLDLLDDDLAGDWSDLGLPMFFGDATRLPFTDRSIDLVVGLEVMEHIPTPGAALREIARPLTTALLLMICAVNLQSVFPSLSRTSTMSLPSLIHRDRCRGS